MAENPAWQIRKATAQDRDAIEELCTASVGPDDYVLDLLDYLLTRSTVHIAWIGDRAIGMLAFHRLSDGSGWISSARTRPEHRRQGVARSLVESLVRIGQSKGAKSLRLWTESNNMAGYAAFTRSGFKEIARFSRMIAPAAKRPASLKPELTEFSEALWRPIEESEILAKSHFYISHGFGFLKVSRPVIKHFADESTLFTWSGQGSVLAEQMSDGKEMLDAQPLFGNTRAMLHQLPGIAKAQGLSYVHTFLPHDRTILKMAAENGFETGEWAREAVLCERLI